MSITFRDGSDVSLEDFMGGDDRACLSAWVSFGNDDEEKLQNRNRVGGLINFLYSNQHMTPFESTVFTFRVKTTISVAREFFRHRSASYNEWSGRYSEMLPEFYLPNDQRPLVQAGKPGDYHFVQGSQGQHNVVDIEYRKTCEQAWSSYQNMLGAGIAKEVARNVLPLSTYTYFYVTMNARNLMHFVSLRNESHALEEIQEVGQKMEEILAEKMPLTYNAFFAERERQSAVSELLKLGSPEELLKIVKNAA